MSYKTHNKMFKAKSIYPRLNAKESWDIISKFKNQTQFYTEKTTVVSPLTETELNSLLLFVVDKIPADKSLVKLTSEEKKEIISANRDYLKEIDQLTNSIEKRLSLTEPEKNIISSFSTDAFKTAILTYFASLKPKSI